MAAVDALGFGDDDGRPAIARWVVGGGVALALHAGLLIYLTRAPAPHAFDNQSAIEIDMAPAPTPAGAQSPAEAAQEAQPEELEEIQPDEAVLPEELEAIDAVTPLDELTDSPPDAATTVEQFEAVETPPDVQAAVTLPPEQAVKAREEEVTPRPTPKPVVKRVEPKPKPEPKPEPKPVVRRDEPKPVAREERPKPKPDVVRGETARKAQAGTAASSAASAGRQGATNGNAAAAKAATAAYDGRVRSAIKATQSCVSGVNGRAVVRFTVNRGGRVISISVSGDAGVTSAAQAMVRRAALPAMPAEMTAPSATYALPISLKKC